MTQLKNIWTCGPPSRLGRKILWLVAIMWLGLSCSTKFIGGDDGESDSNNDEGYPGSITGQTKNYITGQGVAGVAISVDVKGSTYRTTSDSSGDFTLEVDGVDRSDGYTVQFQKKSFENASRSVIFITENMRADLDDVGLYPKGKTSADIGATGSEPVVNFYAPAATIWENAGTVAVVAVLNKVQSNDVIVPFTVAGSAGADGQDHDLEAGVITIGQGQTQASVIFSITNDVAPEADKTIVITMGSVSGAGRGNISEYVITLADDDVLRVNFEKSTQSVYESGQTISVTARLSFSHSAPVTIPVLVQGTALSPADFSATYPVSAGNIVIAAGETTGKVDITLVDDGDGESDEDVIIEMETPTPSSVELGAVNVYTLVIRDNERTIRGQILDNFSSAGLAGASVSVQDSNLVTQIDVTDANGFFTIVSNAFNQSSSYNITVEKTDYIARTDLSVTINGSDNVMDDSPSALFRAFGNIIGNIKDDDGAGPDLPDVAVTAVDSAGNTIATVSNGSGFFRLESSAFYLGNSYTVSFSKADYQSTTTSVGVSVSGDNTVNANPVVLAISAQLTGTVTDSGAVPIAGATVETVCNSQTISTVTDAAGQFSLGSNCFSKGVQYSVTTSSADYNPDTRNSPAVVAGENDLGTIQLALAPTGGNTILRGQIADYWIQASGQGSGDLAGVAVQAVDSSSVMRTDVTDGSGDFVLSGDFQDSTGYTLSFSKSGYTGQTSAAGGSAPVTMIGTDFDSGTHLLYPLGIYVELQRSSDGSSIFRNFTAHRKQTFEKFLTDVDGFTASARTSTNLNSAETFYVHFDDDLSFPALPAETKHSNHMGVNAGAVKGVVVEGIGNDARTGAWEVVNFVYYHFYAAQTGSYTIATSGGTDTYLELFNSSGSGLNSDNNSGAGTNASITHSLAVGWHFVKVSGATDNQFGFYDLSISGPDQTGQFGATTYNTTSDAVISWYDNGNNRMYIAAPDETGSSGTIDLDAYGPVGGIIRSEDFGSTLTMRAVDNSGQTAQVLQGYFNLIRTE